jgi:hypothetical protein
MESWKPKRFRFVWFIFPGFTSLLLLGLEMAAEPSVELKIFWVWKNLEILTRPT